MGLQKNVAGQKWVVFAFDRTNSEPVTGDASNITATINKDFAGATATDDANPTELAGGFYAFDLTQAETNANHLLLIPASETADVQVIAVPGCVFTVPAAFQTLAIANNAAAANVAYWSGAIVSTPDEPGKPVVTIATGTSQGRLQVGAGNVVVGSTASGAITASSIAPDAIGASELAADAVAEIVAAVCADLDAGGVPLALSQAVPEDLTTATVGGALNGARVQAFGKWVIDEDAQTVTLFASDDATPVHVFALDSLSKPLARTPA